MYLDLVIYEQLERARRERLRREPVALELPLPMPRYPEGEEEDSEEESTPRGVVIIDMNDYSDLSY